MTAPTLAAVHDPQTAYLQELAGPTLAPPRTASADVPVSADAAQIISLGTQLVSATERLASLQDSVRVLLEAHHDGMWETQIQGHSCCSQVHQEVLRELAELMAGPERRASR